MRFHYCFKTILVLLLMNFFVLDAHAESASSALSYSETSFVVSFDKKDTFVAPALSVADGYDGIVTYVSSNPSVASVDAEGQVVILAVGQATITASATSTDNFNESEASFALTVNDISPSSTNAIFYESFKKTKGLGADGEGNENAWNGNNIGRGDVVCDNDDWYLRNCNGTNQSIKAGIRDDKGYARTPYIYVEIGKDYVLSFKAAPWDKENTTMTVAHVTECSMEGLSTDEMVVNYWNNFTATIRSEVTPIRFVFSASKNRFFLDEVKVVPATEEAMEVTIPISGWGTYCCQMPLDLTSQSLPDGFKAYAVTETSSSNVTLTEISQKLKGGTGIIINGTPGATYSLKVADAGTAYSGTNLLSGTLSPTYIEAGQYFLKSGKFVYSSAGTLPANKAYLKSANAPEAAANLTFIVEEPSGISELHRMAMEEEVEWYDLSGRVVTPSAKGIYIRGGKKILVK